MNGKICFQWLCRSVPFSSPRQPRAREIPRAAAISTGTRAGGVFLVARHHHAERGDGRCCPGRTPARRCRWIPARSPRAWPRSRAAGSRPGGAGARPARSGCVSVNFVSGRARKASWYAAGECASSTSPEDVAWTGSLPAILVMSTIVLSEPSRSMYRTSSESRMPSVVRVLHDGLDVLHERAARPPAGPASWSPGKPVPTSACRCGSRRRARVPAAAPAAGR